MTGKEYIDEVSTLGPEKRRLLRFRAGKGDVRACVLFLVYSLWRKWPKAKLAELETVIDSLKIEVKYG